MLVLLPRIWWLSFNFWVMLGYGRREGLSQSCPTLYNPMDYTVQRIFQARILEWAVFPFSRGSSQPRDRTQVSHIAGGFFTSWGTREARGNKPQGYGTHFFPGNEILLRPRYPGNVLSNPTEISSISYQHVIVIAIQSLSHVWLFATPWTAGHQAPLSSTNFWSLLRFKFIELVMLSSHFILCCPLLLLPSIFSSIRVFSNEFHFASGGQSTGASSSASVISNFVYFCLLRFTLIG